MARVWREGQKKSVYIYRLIAKAHIEESILRRQNKKGLLSIVLEEEGDIANHDAGI